MTAAQLDLFTPAVWGHCLGPTHRWTFDPVWGQWVAVCNPQIRTVDIDDKTADRPARLCRDCERMEDRG